MCGIAAIYSSAQQGPSENVEARLDNALKAQVHRGPDGSGIWRSADGRLGLGSTRLATVGLSNGRQPLHNETGSVHAVVNGEFYDHAPLRNQLVERGHRFATESDSELLVHLYEDHGLEAMLRLRGEFAFVLWDETAQRLVAGRDRFGIKPLVYYRGESEWCFASEIKGLLAMGLTARWDEAALRATLAHQYPRVRQTLFAGVKQVAPAHLLVMEKGGVREAPYWRPPFRSWAAERKVVDDDAAAWASQTRALLERAVLRRIQGDVPVACTLSGGLDSSAVAVMTARATGQPVDCFTVRFDASGYDEGLLVRHDVAQIKETLRVHEVTVSRRDLVTELDASVRQSEGLAINGQLVGKHLLSRAIHAAGYKVVLAGEGADECFHGYAHLQADWARWRSSAPMAFTGDAYSAQAGVMLPAADEAASWSVPAWLGALPTFLQAKLATGRQYSALLNADWAQRLDQQAELDITLAEMQSSKDLAMEPSPPRCSAWLWTRLAMANYILRTLGDAAEMGASVEARLPFLDDELFDFAATLPTDAFYRDGHSKAVLRDALADVLPDAVRWRPKHPFLAPPLLTTSDAMVEDYVSDVLHSQNCRDLPFLNHAAALDWFAARHKWTDSQKTAYDPVLMTLLTATLLQKNYRLT